MVKVQSRQLVLKKKPTHEGAPSIDDFELMTVSIGEPTDGEVLARNIWMSVDPYQAALMSRGIYPVGQVPEGRAAGQVVQSKSPKFKVGDYVTNHLAWREYVLADADKFEKVVPEAGSLRDYIGPLGITGLTAYVGLFPLANLKDGEAVFVSGAAGAVGMVAVQLAKARGCYVVGTAGTDEKCRWLEEVAKIDKAINYKTCGDIGNAIASAFPGGIDVYFDNVGGDQLIAALNNMNVDGRVAICGVMSSHSKKATGDEATLMLETLTMSMIIKSLRFGGVNVDRYRHLDGEFLAEMTRLVKAGKMKWEDTIEHGLENAPKALVGIFHGRNTGKMLVKISSDNAV